MSALRNVGTEKSNVGMDREIEQTYHELTD